MSREVLQTTTNLGLDSWRATPPIFENPLANYVKEIAKAGFDIPAELSRRPRLQRKFGKAKGNLIWVAGLTDEVAEHAFEYSRGDIVRKPPPYELVEGKLFSSRFDAFASEITSSVERGGSVVRGLEEVERKLTRASDSSYVLWSSPDGPLRVGNLEYDYSWTHIFWKERKMGREKVNYISIRSDFSLGEHVDFLNLFLPEKQMIQPEDYKFNQMGLIKAVLESPVVIDSANVRSLEDIGRYMSFVRKSYSNVVYRDKQTGQIRTFAELIAQLGGVQANSESERTILKGVIEEYERRLNKEEDPEKAIRIIGSYLLAVNYLVKNELEGQNIGDGKVDVNLLAHQVYFSRTLDEIQKVAGCAGGLRQNTSTFTSHSSETTFEGKCPVCGKYVKVDLGERCPGCKTVYACG